MYMLPNELCDIVLEYSNPWLYHHKGIMTEIAAQFKRCCMYAESMTSCYDIKKKDEREYRHVLFHRCVLSYVKMYY